MSLSGAGSAAYYDFFKEGKAKEFGYASWDSDVDNAFSGMPGGLTITASNGLTGASRVGYGVFFDGPWRNPAANSAFDDPDVPGTDNGAPGGLGVCSTGDGLGDACDGTSDDNQMPGEHIHMVFDVETNIDSIDLVGNHAEIPDNTFLLFSVNGAAEQSLDIGGGASILSNFMLNLTNVVTLDYHVRGGEIYMAGMTTSPVPVPAAFWLFGTALFGFIAFSRRTKV